jgi:RNA polymerase sigma factor (sigma-70 family)
MSSDLIQRLRKRADSERLWEAWYKSTYPMLYFAAFRLANGNADIARDLTQETFTRFLEYRAIDRVENEQHALAYLIKTCRNLAIDRNAHAKAVPMENLTEVEVMSAPEQSAGSIIDLSRAVDELDVADRELVHWMRDGLGVGEIAAKLGISYTAAGVRVHRLKNQLRKALE